MNFLSTEEGRVGTLAGINLTMASVGPWAETSEAVLKLLLLSAQLAVAWLTVWYIYRKVKSKKVDEQEKM